MTITTRLFSYFNGKFVGEDAFGNRYFTEKKTGKNRRAKRWVLYKGMAEPSKVPAEWHGWLHYTFDVPPTQTPPAHHEWEKTHIPNLTGTAGAYLPEGFAGGKPAQTTADYQAWTPK